MKICGALKLLQIDFLRNMVRAIVGTLIEVGRGRMSIEEFNKVIQQKNRCAAAESVPGEALFLVNIKYPDSLFLHYRSTTSS